MPTRVTRSRSYSYKLLGVRHTVRRTTTQGSRRSGPSVQVHFSGRDYLEMQRQHTEQCQQLAACAVSAHVQAMAHLNPVARWLHTYLGAGVLAVVYVVCAALAFAANQVMPLALLTVALLAVDWHNMTTLHGRVPWKLWFYDRRTFARWMVALYVVLFEFVPLVYIVQAFLTVPEVRDIQRAQLDGSIAELERELMPEAATASDVE